MKVIDGKKVWCKDRKELAKTYFNTFGDGIASVYAEGNMGIITLLSDLQHVLEYGAGGEGIDYWNEILNDVKCVLGNDDRKRREG